MICDKQLLQILEELGKNSRKVKSLVASEDDTRCAKTLRNIIEGNQKKFSSCNLLILAIT